MKISPPSSKQKQFLNAIESNDVPTVQKLIAEGIDLDTRDKGGSTALMRASLLSYGELVKLLIKAGADANLHDNIGKTALHYAAQEYQDEIARFLIEAGADVNSQDIHGNTPLSDAVFYSKGRGLLIELLRKSGANDNLSNKHGVTPISLAKTISNFDVAQFFKK
jgi:uncharacterized protein